MDGRLGNNDVRAVEGPVPDITEECDAIVQVTGTTIALPIFTSYTVKYWIAKRDILGNEFTGGGNRLRGEESGRRTEFQFACGDCRYYKE
jgi:hypothetical protein